MPTTPTYIDMHDLVAFGSCSFCKRLEVAKLKDAILIRNRYGSYSSDMIRMLKVTTTHHHCATDSLKPISVGYKAAALGRHANAFLRSGFAFFPNLTRDDGYFYWLM
jgi:hypothetical protein